MRGEGNRAGKRGEEEEEEEEEKERASLTSASEVNVGSPSSEALSAHEPWREELMLEEPTRDELMFDEELGDSSDAVDGSERSVRGGMSRPPTGAPESEGMVGTIRCVLAITSRSASDICSCALLSALPRRFQFVASSVGISSDVRWFIPRIRIVERYRSQSASATPLGLGVVGSDEVDDVS